MDKYFLHRQETIVEQDLVSKRMSNLLLAVSKVFIETTN